MFSVPSSLHRLNVLQRQINDEASETFNAIPHTEDIHGALENAPSGIETNIIGVFQVDTDVADVLGQQHQAVAQENATLRRELEKYRHLSEKSIAFALKVACQEKGIQFNDRDLESSSLAVDIGVNRFIQKYKYNPRYQDVWCATASSLKGNPAALEAFFDLLEEAPHDLIGIHQQRLMMRCLHEARGSLDSIRVTQITNHLMHWISTEIRITGQAHLGHHPAFPKHLLFKFLNNISEEKVIKGVIPVLGDQILSQLGLNFVVPLLKNKPQLKKVIIKAIAAQFTQSITIPEHLISLFTRLAGDRDWEIRDVAIDALRKQPKWSNATLQSVINRLEDRDWWIRKTAIDALSTLAHWSNTTLQIVINKLEEKDYRVKQAAISALGERSKWSDITFQSIMRQLNNDNEWVRRTAIEKLSGYANWQDTALQAIMPQWENENWEVIGAVIEVLSTRPEWSDTTLQAIISKLEDEDYRVIMAAIDALGTRPQWSETISQTIIDHCLQGKDRFVKQAAIKSLGTRRKWSDVMLQTVICQLENKDWVVATAAIDALGTQLKWSETSLQKIIGHCLNTKNKKIKEAALRVLGTRLEWSDAMLQAVICQLENKDSAVIQAALHALGKQNEWSESTFQAVIRYCLENKDWQVRQNALYELGKQNEWSESTLQAVIPRLGDEEEYVRMVASDVLSKDSNASALYKLLPTLDLTLSELLYKHFLSETPFNRSMPLYIEDSKLCFYTTEGIFKTISLDSIQESSLRKLFEKTQEITAKNVQSLTHDDIVLVNTLQSVSALWQNNFA